MASANQIAALDLGSNSFHLIVAQYEDGILRVSDRLRERVALARGLRSDRTLSSESMERAFKALRQFAERVHDIPKGRVRVVGTNALRQARNGLEFIERAEHILGHPLEIIAGREEARLIYLGVVQTTAIAEESRLVVDIGGGSTECIYGQGFDIHEADSLLMGCVSFSQKFFGGGFTKSAFSKAETAASLELEPLWRAFQDISFQTAIGCSGTIQAVKRIGQASEWFSDRITYSGLKRLKKAMLAAGQVESLSLPGLDEDRKPVLAGGVAILIALFRFFGMDDMQPSAGALREGALYDLMGRIQNEDIRDRSIRSVCERFKVDLAQAEQISKTAHKMLDGVVPDWISEPGGSAHVLTWAGYLHSIGLSVGHSGYHKHSAYLVENSDWAGFSQQDQSLVAAIIRAHRRKLKSEYFDRLPKNQRREGFRLGMLFRLAYALHRDHRPDTSPPLTLRAEANRLSLALEKDWLEAHPLIEAELHRQVKAFTAAGVELEILRN